MKKIMLLVSLTCLIINGCRKSGDILRQPQENFADAALQYLEAHTNNDEYDELDIAKHQVIQLEGKDHFLYVPSKNTKANTSILIAMSKNSFNGFRNTITYGSNYEEGTIHTETLDKTSGTEIIFAKGQVVRIIKKMSGKKIAEYKKSNTGIFKTGSDDMINATPVVSAAESDPTTNLWLPPVTVTAYVGSTPNYYSSFYYATNMNSTYYNTYAPVPYLGAPLSASGISSAVNMVIIPPAQKPVNIAAELKCFTIVANAKYFLTINVNQPIPNTDGMFNLYNSYSAGHTFITLEQRNPNGSIIKRSVGFYPSATASPASTVIPSVFNDDSQTPYSVAMTMSVSASEMQTVKNYLVNNKQPYNLNSYNCTNVAIDAIAQAGVYLPRTYGTIYAPRSSDPTIWDVPVFRGLNPGDLGQDIRNMNEATLSSLLRRSIVIIRSNANDKRQNKVGTCP